jgi:hypothetical protein
LSDGDYVGVQVKNRVEYPKPSDVNIFIELCRTLHLRPLLIARQVYPMTFDVVSRLRGRVVIFKQILLKPGFPRETLEALWMLLKRSKLWQLRSSRIKIKITFISKPARGL